MGVTASGFRVQCLGTMPPEPPNVWPSAERARAREGAQEREYRESRERQRESRDRETETDRDRQRQTETDRDRQRQTETDRDRQRQTERKQRVIGAVRARTTARWSIPPPSAALGKEGRRVLPSRHATHT